MWWLAEPTPRPKMFDGDEFKRGGRYIDRATTCDWEFDLFRKAGPLSGTEEVLVWKSSDTLKPDDSSWLMVSGICGQKLV